MIYLHFKEKGFIERLREREEFIDRRIEGFIERLKEGLRDEFIERLKRNREKDWKRDLESG